MQRTEDALDIGKVRNVIIGFVCDELKLSADKVSGTTHVRELPGAESVKVLRVIARIERAFSIELDDEIVFRVESIDELADAVAKLNGANAK